MNGFQQNLKKIRHVTGLFCLRFLCKFTSSNFFSTPVLLLSYPRSGSSWAGKILATSAQLAYVREPVTQPYLKKFDGERTVFHVEKSHKDINIYKNLADDVFAGLPSLHKGVVNNKRDFLPSTSKTPQRLLIKEVNPAAAAFYCQYYKPLLLLLLRHPAAVALSFNERGWLKKHGELLEGTSGKDDWWRFGKLYGTYMAEAVEITGHYKNARIIHYEALVNDPKQHYSDIFVSCGVDVPENFESIIERYCHSKDDLSSGYQTKRNSKVTSEKWKNKLNAQQLASIREGFFESNLNFYREPSDWVLK